MNPSEVLKLSFTVVVEQDGNSFHAYCPGLKGIHVDGDTHKEALENASEAVRLYVASMIRNGEALPIGADFSAHVRKNKTYLRKVEMSWPSAQMCGVS